MALAALPAPAAAQASDAAAAGPQLTEVIVTAQRKTESLQRAAVAVAVVGSAQLNNSGIVTAASLNAVVPSIIVTKAGGANTSYYIRGVGNFTVNAYSDPAIAFNLDGVYLGRPTSTTGTFFDLDRVEVLKGPQGTLYGRNATGGAVNVIPTRPVLGQFGGYAAAGYGSYGAADAEGAVNLPIGERAAFRLAGKYVQSDGYNDDGANDEDGYGLRGQFLAKLGEAATVRLAADYSHQGGVGPGASYNGLVSYAPGAPATGSSVANYSYSDFNLDPYSGLHSTAGKALQSNFAIGGAFINPVPLQYPFLDNDYWGVNAEVTLDTGVGAFSFIPAVRDARLDSRFNGPAFLAGLVNEHDEQSSAELRLQGRRVGPVDWLVGGYLFDETLNGRYTFAQYQVTPLQQFHITTKSYAVFGQATFHVTEALRLVGGLRYTNDDKGIDARAQTLVELCTRAPPPAGPGCFGGPSIPAVNSIADLPFNPQPTVVGVPVPFGTAGNLLLLASDQTFNTSKTSDRVTYRAAVEYDLAPNSLLYASYETGYRGGGFSLSVGHETYDPEYITAATIGSKNRFLDNRLQLNVEIFQWKYTNQQVSHFGFDLNNNSSLFTENIGRSTIKGFDVDGQWLAAENTLLRGGVQYVDNTLDSFIYINPRGGANLPPVTGCPVTGGVQGGLLTYVVNCSGLAGFNAPKWSINAGIDQTFALGGYKLVITVDGRYRSSRVVGFERIPQQIAPSDTTFDASAKFGAMDDKWVITGYVRNITDVAVPVLTQYSGSTGGSVSTNYAPPRTYGVRLSARF